jgi:enamine deaminase RidA (YjgF/YER057c/UK114 family)
MPLSVLRSPRPPPRPQSQESFGVKHYAPDEKLDTSWLYWRKMAAMPRDREWGERPPVEPKNKNLLSPYGTRVMEASSMSAEARIAELKLELPPAPKPVAVYQPLVIAGHMAYVSGHGPLKPDKSLILGRVGADLDLAAGKLAARQVGLAILATLRSELGSLDRVKRLIKVLGMVNSTPDFRDHPAVINGCSELFADVWGREHGIGARSAVGMGSLPGNIAVEIEAIFELNP